MNKFAISSIEFLLTGAITKTMNSNQRKGTLQDELDRHSLMLKEPIILKHGFQYLVHCRTDNHSDCRVILEPSFAQGNVLDVIELKNQLIVIMVEGTVMFGGSQG